ncbi:MAG TPA: hypothetical protein VGJ81_06410 [Thermoanaerobaculia bacterium]|jgi:hypothetical protein
MSTLYYFVFAVGLVGIVLGFVGLHLSLRRFEDDFHDEVRHHADGGNQMTLPRLQIKNKG